MAQTVKQEAGIAPNPEKPKLRRSLGLFELTMYGVGIILGAGIYAIIGVGAGVAGNALWLSFLIGAIIASFTGLSYAELGTMFPKEAAEYVYMKRAFKKEYPAFLVGWLIIIVGTIAASVVALGFGGYLEALTGIPALWGALALVLGCSFLNYRGIRESANANIIFTVIEMLGLILIILFGMSHVGSVDYFEMPGGLNGVMMAAVLVFFAYVGFEDVVNLSEETKSPRKVMPKALILSVVITTIMYILVSLVAVSVIPWNVLAESSAPIADVAEASLPGTGW
ncbi:MAG: amino acid permease, partial [Candidatus Aenigmarchaeota archaeon]|nr:amino acid permease [Candidatus Aenigmarchaeota archaeon]